MTIQVTNVKVLDNPSTFLNPFKFEITFDCLAPGIKGELDWKLIYVASASDQSLDQELDTVLVGPIKIGKNRFIFEAPPPDVKKIPSTEIVGVTVVLLICEYKEQEFIRIGFYVSNEIESNNDNNNDNDSDNNNKIDISKIKRHILGNKPRVTRFPIKWDDIDDLQDIYDENESNNNNNNNNNINSNDDINDNNMDMNDEDIDLNE